jgi:hypothetical protein
VAGNTTLETEVARVQGTPRNRLQRRIDVWRRSERSRHRALTECGRLNASSEGTLIGRQVFGVITKGASDSFVLT